MEPGEETFAEKMEYYEESEDLDTDGESINECEEPNDPKDVDYDDKPKRKKNSGAGIATGQESLKAGEPKLSTKSRNMCLTPEHLNSKK